jgi:hypothetical protein
VRVGSGAVMLVVGVLSMGAAAGLDLVFRLRMTQSGRKWALLQGDAFNYSEYHRVRKERGWPAWPVYLMWSAMICGIILLIAGSFTYFGTSPK